MKLFLECVPCFLRQALFVLKDLDAESRTRIFRKVVALINDSDWDVTSDEIANKMYSLVRRETGVFDPYKEIKTMNNKAALKLYPEAKARLEQTPPQDRLCLTAKLAIAGNIIDYGPGSDFNLEKTVEEVLNKDLAVNDFAKLVEKAMSAKSLLYFADNAGEIVFDKMFIKEMMTVRGRPFEHLSFVIKGGPILNDAMLTDAYEVGIEELPNVEFYKLGNGEKGTGPNRSDRLVKEWIAKHDLVISKGQGNFEGLSEHRGIFYMLLAKCPVIAQALGVEVKDTVIRYA